VGVQGFVARISVRNGGYGRSPQPATTNMPNVSTNFMKTTTIIFLFFFIPGLAYTQEFKGKYNNKDFYFFFDKEFVEFNVGSNGGLIFPLKGIGKFQYFENYLIIYTSKFDKKKTRYYTKDQFEEIIEDKIVVFKLVYKDLDRFELILIDVGSIKNMFTTDMLKRLEKDVQKYEPQLQKFGK